MLSLAGIAEVLLFFVVAAARAAGAAARLEAAAQVDAMESMSA